MKIGQKSEKMLDFQSLSVDQYGPMWTFLDHSGPLWSIVDHFKLEKLRSNIKLKELQWSEMKMFLAIFDQENVEIRPKKMHVTHVYFCQGIQKRGQNFCPQEKIFRKKSDEGVLKWS